MVLFSSAGSDRGDLEVASVLLAEEEGSIVGTPQSLMRSWSLTSPRVPEVPVEVPTEVVPEGDGLTPEQRAEHVRAAVQKEIGSMLKKSRRYNAFYHGGTPPTPQRLAALAHPRHPVPDITHHAPPPTSVAYEIIQGTAHLSHDDPIQYVHWKAGVLKATRLEAEKVAARQAAATSTRVEQMQQWQRWKKEKEDEERKQKEVQETSNKQYGKVVARHVRSRAQEKIDELSRKNREMRELGARLVQMDMQKEKPEYDSAS